MEEKTFTFVASGLAFNLVTFETENKTFLTAKNTITFKSKQEFIKAIDHAIENFYVEMIKRLEEGIPKLYVEYKGESVGLKYTDLSGLNSYAKNTHIRETRDLIMSLVKNVETRLHRVDVYEDLPVELQR